MVEAWAFAGAPPVAEGPPAVVTLVDGATFCIAASDGSIVADGPMGLYVHDARVLSRWEMTVDDARLEPLMVDAVDLMSATFVARAAPRPGRSESTVLVTRRRELSGGLADTVSVRNLGRETAGVTLAIDVDADFADLFEVKEGRVTGATSVQHVATEDALELRAQLGPESRTTRVVVSGGASGVRRLVPGRIVWQVSLEPRAEWSVRLDVEVLIDDRRPGDTAASADRTSASRYREWRVGAPVLSTPDPGLSRTLARSLEDLGALRIRDADHPDRTVVAAGAPWFMAVFGRDSLLTSWMVLPLDLRLALGTLQTLAEHQGTTVDPFSEEEPGRILHERRAGPITSLPMGGGGVYYGSVDATPLFVMLLGELRRWGQAEADVDALMPAADRALEWITTYGDRDGDGFVEYRRATDRGLLNQGWKDSARAIVFADGRVAEPPIALAEVQGYVYGAYLARAHFAREAGDEPLSRSWAQRASDLKARFNEAFWLPDRGYYAMALDGDKRPVDALASNMGHCLWTGIIDESRADDVVERLMHPDMFSGWGIRTLSSSMAAYNPLSYHKGSVWPHDNAIIAAGLARYGFAAEAQQVATAVFDAADALGGRLPELYCGFDRGSFSRPVPFPTACAPQAWAAAAPLLLLRTLLRFDPWVPFGEVRLAPAIPSQYLPLRLSNVALAGRRVTLDVTAEGFTVDGLTRDVVLVPEPRRAVTAMLP